MALPALLLTAAVAIGAGNALSRDTLRVELVGTKSAPAVVISQNDRAVVLYRGGKTTRNAVEITLARRNVRTVEAFLDLRINHPTTMRRRRNGPPGGVLRQGFRAGPPDGHRAAGACPHPDRLRGAGDSSGPDLPDLSGTVRFAQPIEVDWLLASMARPNRVVYREMLTKSTNYRWMEGDGNIELQTALRFRPSSFWKISRSPSAGKANRAAGSSLRRAETNRRGSAVLPCTMS